MQKKQLPKKKKPLTKKLPAKKVSRKKKIETIFYQTDCFGWLYEEGNSTCKKCGHSKLCAHAKLSLDATVAKTKNAEIHQEITQRYQYKALKPFTQLDMGISLSDSMRAIIFTRDMILNGEYDRVKRKINVRGKHYIDNIISAMRCDYGLCSCEKQFPLNENNPESYIFIFKIWNISEDPSQI